MTRGFRGGLLAVALMVQAVATAIPSAAVAAANRPPDRPTDLTTAPSTRCTASPPDLIGKSDVTLSARVHDPDNPDRLDVTFAVWQGTGQPKIQTTSAGNAAPARVRIPADEFDADGEYSWRVTVTDRDGASSTSRTCRFALDRESPAAAPTVTSDQVQSDVRSPLTVGTPIDFTFTANGVPDVVGFRYSLGMDSLDGYAAADAPGGRTTVTLVPLSPWGERVFVKSVDKAGNVSRLNQDFTVKLSADPGGHGFGDYNGDGRADLFGRDGQGLAFFHPQHHGGYVPRGLIDDSWGRYRELVRAGNVDRLADPSGYGDLIGVTREGEVQLLPGRGGGDFVGSGLVILDGLADLDEVVMLGDVDGDRNPDLLVRTAGGDLLLYPGDGYGDVGDPRKVGSGRDRYYHVLGGGDYDGDGAADLLARTGDGRLYLVHGDGSGEFGHRTLVGAGWNRAVHLVAAGDLNGDGNPDLAAVDSRGTLCTHLSDGSGRFGRGTVAGTDWQRYDLVF